MAECLECLDNLTIEDILNKIAVCDENGNVSWRMKLVEEYATDCHSCGQFSSVEDMLRKSLYCEDGVWYLQITTLE